MLKRIKIRGKLLLLLITPLLAIGVFAADGVLDRLDRSEASAREARLATFAAANADLSTALQVEQFQSLLTGRVMGAFSEEGRADQMASDQALTAWRQALAATRTDLTDGGLRADIVVLETDLAEILTPDRSERYAPTDLAELLGQTAERLNDVVVGLQYEATGVELFQALEGVAALVRVQESLAEIVLIGDRTIASEPGNGAMAILVRDAVTGLTLAYDRAAETVDPDDAAALEQLVAEGHLPRMAGSASAVTGGFDAIGEISVATQRGALAGGVDWTTASAHRLNELNTVLTRIADDAAFAAAVNAERIETEAGQFVLLAASFVALAMTIAMIMGRSVAAPLTELTETARVLAADELPAMVESMRTAGRAPAAPPTPVPVKGRDEVAQLGRAFADIRTVTAEVAEEQGNLLRRGISDIFVNLARRNQSLLDRQIDFIDQLESSEENPDQLENLFRLDHLATRMRRNAESLLVLAGAEPTRRRGRLVELGDVVRVAMGEIEDFGRIQLLSIDSATVSGSVAVDLAHLLSELMENATTFSPPDTDVEVVGHHSGDGSYQVTLTDRGIGMSAEQLATANATLAEPPVIGLDLSRSLGFTVVSRLADRLGVTVRLTGSPEGGVTALVTVPSDLVAAAPVEVPETPSPAPAPPGVGFAPSHGPEVQAPAPIASVPPAPTAPVAPAIPESPLVGGPSPFGSVSPQPEPSAEAEPGRVPVGPAATSGPPTTALFGSFAPAGSVPAPPTDRTSDLFSAFDTAPRAERPGPEHATRVPFPPGPAPQPPAADGPPTPADPAQPGVPPVDTISAHPPAAAPVPPTRDVSAEPPPAAPLRSAADVGAVDRSVTSAGLIRRTPKPTTSPVGSVGGAERPGPGQPAMGAGNRSPEEVRQMLSRYRAGLRHGRGSEEPPSPSNRRS